MPTSTDSVLAAGYGSHLPREGYREPVLGPENTQKAVALELYGFGTLVKSQGGTKNRLS